MASIKKFSIIGIFISILTVFAMSYNVSALGVYNFDNYSIPYKTLTPQLYQCNYNGTVVNNVAWCEPTGATQVGIRQMILSPSLSFKKGDIVKFDIVVVSRDDYDIREIIKFNRFQLNTDKAYVLDYSLVDPAVISLQNYTTQNSNNNLESFDILAGLRTYYLWRFEIRFTDDYSGRIGFETNNYSEPIITYFDQRTSSGTYGMFRFRAINFVQYRFEGSEENREQQEKTQEAVDDSQSAGSSSSSSASQGGANLLTAITGFFGVITSAQPTNCRFNAPLNTYFGNERLNVDLCSLDLPSGIGALTSIIAIGILIPFAIHMFNKFVALFRSFQS